MSTFALVHGAGDVGWYWHLVEAELRARGHDTVAPDLPAGDDEATLDDYADVVADAVGERADLVVVGQSFGAFTAPLVAARRPVSALVLVAGMIPSPGEPPDQWWDNTGYPGGGDDDPFVTFYHDVPRSLAEQADAKGSAHPSRAAGAQPWPLEQWPDVPTSFVLCTGDRLFPADFMRKVVAERLGVTPIDIAAGHCVALSRPAELADALEAAGRRAGSS